MNGFFSIIGSTASLISVPLAIYLFLKSKEAKFDKLKKDIARILSYQIGDERKLSTFEIKTVISSKLRENNINADSVTVSEIIEDLVSETISSPLIGKDRKTEILENLKKLYFRGEIFEEIDNISETDIQNWDSLEHRFKTIFEHRSDLDKQLYKLKENTDRYRQRISTIFAIMSFLMIVITLIISVVGKNTFLEWNQKLNEPFKHEFIITIILSSLTSIISGLGTFVFRKKIKRKRNDHNA